MALLDHRDIVTLDDIKAVVSGVLTHRTITTNDATKLRMIPQRVSPMALQFRSVTAKFCRFSANLKNRRKNIESHKSTSTRKTIPPL